MKHRPAALAAAILFCAAGTACTNSSVPLDWRRSGPVSAADPAPGGVHRAEAPAPARSRASAPSRPAAPVEPRALPLFDGVTGRAVGWFEMVSSLAAADIILIGETHGDPVAQAMLPVLWDDLLGHAPGAWLSLEFFERDHQTALNDYLSGVTGEEEFRRAASRTRGNYPEGHRALVESARQRGRPVVAANAPRRYARLARAEGYERLASLGADQQSLFALPAALTEGRYRDEFEEAMRDMPGHEGDSADPGERLLGYYRAQNLWDATMADSILAPALAGARPVVHVVGRFHTDFDGGLVQRLRAAAPTLRIVTISLVDEAPSPGLREEDTRRADIVVYLR